MTIFNNANKVTTAVLFAGLIGATTCVFAPASEARSYKNKLRHELRVRQLLRVIRRDTRNFWRVRRAYQRELNLYPLVIPVCGTRYGKGIRQHNLQEKHKSAVCLLYL